ncbi:WD repeat-containing protein 61-like [Melitaea cinxia]|uniref:WD repeat-containing protein 61-like n=1 Tax=Melitaea cinxia TaxID=113334 RepID=UPI001E273D6B|nr:WD repeat-containing protein 61-like [Melitaea cinxia]
MAILISKKQKDTKTIDNSENFDFKIRSLSCCSHRRRSVRLAHASWIYDDYVITGGLECRVKVWKIKNNNLELLHTLKGHTMAVVSIAVSPKGLVKGHVNSKNRVFATVSLDSKILLWDLQKGRKIKKINIESADAWPLAFSSDGYFILSGRHNGNLTMTNIANNTVEKEMSTNGKLALSLAWSDDGKHIACGSVDGNVYIFGVFICDEHKLLHTLNLHKETVRCVNFSFSPASHLLVSGSNDGFVKIFDTFEESTICSLKLNAWVMSVCFSPDNTRVAIATADGAVTIALAADLKVLKTFQEHVGKVCDVKFSSDGTKVISVAKDNSINIYECPKLSFF